MRVSTAGRYGLRVLLDLALKGEEGPVSRQKIAGRQNISAEYIAQLIRRLVKAGLVESVMGPGGGYTLKQNAADIRIGDIFRALEGPIATVQCVLEDGKTVCSRIHTCATHVLWVRLSQVIEEYLDSVSLADLKSIAAELETQYGPPNCDPVDSLLSAIDGLEPFEKSCLPD